MNDPTDISGTKVIEVQHGTVRKEIQGRLLRSENGVSKREGRVQSRRKVTLYFDTIASDTNYSFTLDGAELMRDYDPKKGFVLRFTMPDHDVKLHCLSRNTMLVEMPEEE